MSDLDSSDLTLPLLVAIVTFGLLLLHLVLRIGCGRPSPDIVVFYDEANALNYRHQYIVRLLYGPKSTSYEDEITTIFAEVEHSINRIVKIPFTPATMGRVVAYKGHRCAKIFIRTAEPYSNVSKLLMYHNGRGSIIVVALELQDIDAPNSIASVVNNPVFSATGGTGKVTSYSFGREQTTPLEDDIRPTRNVTASESIYLFYTAANAVYLWAMLLLEWHCVGSSQFCDYDQAFIFGAVSGTAGFGLFLLTTLIARFIIKRFYFAQLGRGLSKFLRLFYLGLVVCGGVALGAYTAQQSLNEEYKSGHINEGAVSLKAPTIWSITAGFGLFVLISLIGLSIPLAVYVGFIVLPEEDSHGGGGLLAKLPVRGNGGGGRDYTRDEADNTESPGGNKFKSIEAYSAAASYIEKSQYVHTERKSSGRRRVVPSKSPNSQPAKEEEDSSSSPRGHKPERKKEKKTRRSGGGYAHILATQQKKVRSISQYDVNASEEGSGAEETQDRTAKVRTGRSGKRTQAAGGKQRKTNGPMQQTSEGSSGEHYYRNLVKVGKVKSVSQYVVGGRNK